MPYFWISKCVTDQLKNLNGMMVQATMHNQMHIPCDVYTCMYCM